MLYSSQCLPAKAGKSRENYLVQFVHSRANAMKQVLWNATDCKHSIQNAPVVDLGAGSSVTLNRNPMKTPSKMESLPLDLCTAPAVLEAVIVRVLPMPSFGGLLI